MWIREHGHYSDNDDPLGIRQAHRAEHGKWMRSRRETIDLLRQVKERGLAAPSYVERNAVYALLDVARLLAQRCHEHTSSKPYGRAWFDARRARRRLHALSAPDALNAEDLSDLVDELTCVEVQMRSKSWGTS